jgi:RNA polymerase primary sigma factor
LLKVKNAGKKTAREFEEIIEVFLGDPKTLYTKNIANDPSATSNKHMNNKNIEYLYAQYPFPKTMLELNPSIRLQNILKRVEQDPELVFSNLSDCAFHYKNFIQLISQQKNIGKASIQELSKLLICILSKILTEMSVDQDIANQYNSFLIDSNQTISDYKPRGFSFQFTGVNALFTEVKNNLDQRSFDILCRRFGLEGYSQHTLQEIADIYGVTRERIRQLEKKAIKVKLKTLNNAFFAYLDEQYAEITKQLFENEGYLPKSCAYSLFKGIHGFSLLSINVCYDGIHDYLENHHVMVKECWINNSLPEEKKYALKQEILGFGSLGIKTKIQLMDILSSTPWPIPLNHFQNLCANLSENDVVNGLEEHFEARFENDAVVAVKKGLNSSQKVIIVLRHVGHSLPISQIASLYREMFCQDVTDSYVGNILGSHEEALIVNRGEYNIYENLEINEHDLSEIRDISFEYIRDKNIFISAGRLFNNVFINSLAYGDDFNKYVLYGILQDDSRFIYRAGLMLGLNSFSSELFTSLTDRVCEIVKKHGSEIHIRDIQEELSRERNVLDVTIIMLLENNKHINKTAPATFCWKD